MRAEQRRARGFFAMVVADPYRKLVAIGLAIGLWFFINNQITQDKDRTLPLICVGSQRIAGEGLDRLAIVLPTDRVVGLKFLDGEQEIDKVDVVLSGPRFRIDQIADEPLDLQITSFLTLDWSTRTSIEFTAADIRRDRSLQDVRITLKPSRIKLLVEKITDLPVPLSLNIVELQDDPQLGSRLRRETVEFAPPVPRILGPASSIDQWRKRGGKQFRATFRAVGNERQVSASLEMIGGDELGLRVEPRPVVTIQLLPQTRDFTLELPIFVDDLALPPELRGKYRPETATRIVRIQAGGELRAKLVNFSEQPDKSKLQEWASANLRLLVYIPRLEPGASYGADIDREARLMVPGPMRETLDRAECRLDDVVLVKLRKVE
ncbi:MAG TPA: hypothetical protein VFZ65_06165 [Planctomycetota bacterium]|nr:hypothetical protein [Planctomycetota bacterium]